MDAIGYVIKKSGTSSFFVEPEIYDFMNWIKNMADSLNIEILPEVHADYSIQYALAEHGFWIYDFILPHMILNTIFFRRQSELYKYLASRSDRQFTMLDCHDGIPVKPDVDNLINESDAIAIVEKCMKRGASVTRIVNNEHNDFDVHQIACTFYLALGCDDDAYIAARAIQFFVPGIPQVYYVGLLAEGNDANRVKKTKDVRDVNRHNFSIEEIEVNLDKNVVKRLINLIRFRNDSRFFDGRYTFVDCPDNQVQLKCSIGGDYCLLKIDLSNFKTIIVCCEDSNETEIEI